VSEYIGHFLNGEAIPGIEYEYTLAQRLLPGITLADVNTLARNWITDENRIILVQAPQKPDVKVPTEAELLAVFERAGRAPVVAWTEAVSDEPLLERTPAPGSIVSERTIASINLTEWRLSNGARVLIKPTDFKSDEIVFNAYSVGGSSLVPDADIMSATGATQVVRLSGLGRFNRVDLGKKLTGKVANAVPTIGAVSEGLSGGASPQDLETLLQLVHLWFTAPRLDTVAFQAYRNQITPVLSNRGASPMAVFTDTIQAVMSQHHARGRPLTLATFNEIDPHKAFRIYQDRFADAGDFTFVFVGNVDLAKLKSLAERYLATLPVTGRKENWKDVGMPSPRGVINKVVHKGTEQKAATLIWFTGPIQFSPESRFALRALTDLFQIRLNDVLRERLGGTYSPGVGGGANRVPHPEYSIQIQFGSAPENVEPLAQTVFALIDSLKTSGPSAADVEKVREQMIRTRETDLKTNSYWAGNIAGRDQAGEDLEGLLAPYDAMIRNLTAAQIQQAAQKYFDTKNYVRFVLLPEKTD
jgi:zinc protease